MLDGDLDAFMQAELERLATGGEWRGEEPRRRRRRDDDPGDRRLPAALTLPAGPARRAGGLRRRSGAVASTTTSAGSNQPEIPPEHAPLLRLYAHLQATGPGPLRGRRPPDRPPGGRARRGFASAIVRERLWFLSMCFVLPGLQGARGRTGAARPVGPPDGDDIVRATGTDSAQPISNALYASLGIVPRVPLLNLIGLPERNEAFGPLPSGVMAVPFERLAAEDHGRRRRRSMRSIARRWA